MFAIERRDVELYENAIAMWGIDMQVDILIEEMAELIQAIQKSKRANGGKIDLRDKRIIEEYTDVQICMEQVWRMLESTEIMGDMVSGANVAEAMRDQKLERLQQRLKKAKELEEFDARKK